MEAKRNYHIYKRLFISAKYFDSIHGGIKLVFIRKFLIHQQYYARLFNIYGILIDDESSTNNSQFYWHRLNLRKENWMSFISKIRMAQTHTRNGTEIHLSNRKPHMKIDIQWKKQTTQSVEKEEPMQRWINVHRLAKNCLDKMYIFVSECLCFNRWFWWLSTWSSNWPFSWRFLWNS